MVIHILCSQYYYSKRLSNSEIVSDHRLRSEVFCVMLFSGSLWQKDHGSLKAIYTDADSKVIEMEGKRLYVGNLPYSANEAQIRDLFAPYGTIDSVKLIEQKGFGFVEMSSPEEAQNAMDSLNQTEFGGRTLRIDEARPMQPRREFGGSSGGYGGNRGYGSGGGSSGGYGGNRRRY